MFFEHNGVTVYCESHGEGGQPLLLLHGWGGRCDSFLPVIRDFSPRRRVVALDFPGHGQSTEPPAPWSVEDFADLVAALIEALDIRGADIIGHSQGGRVAIALAAARPELVGRLVLAAAAGLRPRPTLRGKLRGGAYRAMRGVLRSGLARALLGERLVRGLQEQLIQMFGSSDYRVLSPGMRQTFNRLILRDLSPELTRIQSPVLLIWGDRDTATPLWMGQAMEKAIPDAGLVVFEGAGHFAYLDQYARFRAVVDTFLN